MGAHCKWSMADHAHGTAAVTRVQAAALDGEREAFLRDVVEEFADVSDADLFRLAGVSGATPFRGVPSRPAFGRRGAV